MNNLRSIMSSSIGNILEWYDFGLFTLFSSLFSKLFFPSEDPNVAILATLSIFTVGFLCRPLGALLFGYFGDTHGRATTLRLSILMISLPTILIGFLPTYAQAGITAPILLMLTRMWQGISIGGEYSGTIIYLAESASPKYRATITSFASMGANMGILLAALVGVLMSYFWQPTAIEAWAWRVPYIFSGLLSLIIYGYRLNIAETEIFASLKKQQRLAKNPLKTVFQKDPSALLKTLGLVCMGSTFYCFSFIYIPLFMSHNLFFSLRQTSIFMSLMLGLMICLIPLAGLLCDKVGRKPILLTVACFILMGVVPGFFFIQHSSLHVALGILLFFTIISALEQGTTPITLVENFPSAARYTGIALGYNIGNGFIGGTVPLVCEWLLSITKLSLAPAIYIVLCTCITAVTVLYYLPETRGKSLL